LPLLYASSCAAREIPWSRAAPLGLMPSEFDINQLSACEMIDAIAAELTGSGVDNGMGIFLPIILGAALIGALGLVALRLLRGPQQTGS